MVDNLFCYQDKYATQVLVKIWSKIWITLFHLLPVSTGECTPGGSAADDLWQQDDIFVNSTNCGWQAWLKEGDRLWSCPQGRHFFTTFIPACRTTDSQVLEISTPIRFSLFQPETLSKIAGLKLPFTLKVMTS